ncbi:hypothetical protein [Rossellomorea sp. BNER]|uniref:hypothetical protein n=1 Tax=Rossellomorea sp. BNER TaxID=2962031 RepID=UPI003AF26542|nr:hypothetical protein [Rossellomorea sp. BNER]
MGIKINTIVLKDIEIIELENGDFEKRYINPKKYPAFITNRSLATGRNLGITKTSLISELIIMKGVFPGDGEINIDDIKPEQAVLLDSERYLPTIYLGLIGANKDLELSYEEFLDRYHGDIEQILNDYVGLVAPFVQENSNEFAKGLKKSTSTKKSGKAKK